LSCLRPNYDSDLKPHTSNEFIHIVEDLRIGEIHTSNEFIHIVEDLRIGEIKTNHYMLYIILYTYLL